MRILKFAFLFAGVVVLTWVFGFGGLSDVTRWVVTEQRDTQNALAAGLRAVRTGETGAWLALMSICAAYGFFHAVGPGHGKLVIGGLGFATGMTALRLSLLAVAASLAQATVAIVLVVIGAFVLGWGLTEMTALTEEIMAPASYAAIGLVGLWLVFRGVRRGTSTLVYPMDSDRHCDNCGHAHGPSLHQVESMTSWLDALAIVGSIAIRPCTGAVFLLILCFGFGIPWAGIAGTFVMGLGTASVTLFCALIAVTVRRTALPSWSGEKTIKTMAVIEIISGGIIAFISIQLVLPFI